MGDYAGPAGTTADTVSSPQDAADAATSTSEDAYSGPAVTAMGDVGGPAADASTPPASEPESSTPVTTAMGDNTGYTSEPADTTTPTNEPEDTSPAITDDGPAYTPMGDVGMPGSDTTTPAAQPTTPEVRSVDPDGFQANVTATWGLGATVGFAHDSEYTSITLGPAEGTGLFGSVGQGQAARQTTPGASIKGGLGPISGEFGVDQTGITGKANLNIPLNPGVNQVNSYTGKLNPDFTVTTSHTEAVSYGVQQGLASTQTITIAIPNSAFETVANWFGMGPQSANRSGGW
jgi:hypothetical protein